MMGLCGRFGAPSHLFRVTSRLFTIDSKPTFVVQNIHHQGPEWFHETAKYMYTLLPHNNKQGSYRTRVETFQPKKKKDLANPPSTYLTFRKNIHVYPSGCTIKATTVRIESPIKAGGGQ